MRRFRRRLLGSRRFRGQGHVCALLKIPSLPGPSSFQCLPLSHFGALCAGQNHLKGPLAQARARSCRTKCRHGGSQSSLSPSKGKAKQPAKESEKGKALKRVPERDLGSGEKKETEVCSGFSANLLLAMHLTKLLLTLKAWMTPDVRFGVLMAFGPRKTAGSTGKPQPLTGAAVGRKASPVRLPSAATSVGAETDTGGACPYSGNQVLTVFPWC